MKILILFIISITFAKSQLLSTSPAVDVKQAQNIEIESTLKLLKEGHQRVILNNQRRDVTLILGNAGSGKTTFLQWILGDNDKLIAKELADGSFSIEDRNNRIGKSTTDSDTLFPELVLNGSSAYYDCPGFSDTRSTSQDLAVAYFIKRVADHAERVRLVFTIDYSSVGPRADKVDFKNLLSHATHLVKNVNKFSNSIALIATKVETHYRKDINGNLIPIPDSSIINGIGAFLNSVKDAIANDPSKAKLVQLIEVFLLKNSDGSYARIGISRLPRSAGKLSEIKEMQEGKTHIVKMLSSLHFTTKNEENFIYAVSERSNNAILTPMIEKVNGIINEKLSNSMQMARENYKSLAQQVNKEISSIVNSLVSYANPAPVQKLINQLSKGHSTISKLSDKSIRLTKPLEVYEEIKLFTSDFDNNTLNQEMVQIQNYFNVLTFLLEVNKQVFEMPSKWRKTFQAAANNITELRNNLDNTISDITNEVKRSISASIDIVGQWMRRHFDEQITNMKSKIDLLTNGNDEVQIDPNEAHLIRNSLIQGLDALRVLINDIETLRNATVLVDKIQKCANDIKMDLSADIVQNLKKQCARLNFLHTIRSEKMEIDKVWAEQVANTKMFLTGRRNRLKRDVNQMDTESKVAELIEIYSKKLNEYYEVQLKQVKMEMEYFTQKTASREIDVSTANQTLLNLGIGIGIMCDTSEKINTSKTPLELKSVLNDSLFNFNISSSPLELQNIFKESASNLIRFYKWEDLIKNISAQLDILNLTLVATNVKFQVPQSWSTPITNQCGKSQKSFNEFQENFLNKTCESVMALIKSDLNILAQRIIERYEDKLSVDETVNTFEILNKIEKSIIAELSAKNEKEADLFGYLNNVDNCLTQLDIDNEMIYTAFKRYTYLEYTRAFNPDNIALKPFNNNNFDPFKNALKYLQNAQTWYVFLLHLDVKLSEYQIQKDASEYNVSHLVDWGIDNNKPRNISIDRTKFNKVIGKLKLYNEDIEDVEITESRSKSLENVLASNFLWTNETICDKNNQQIVFRGNFIKFSDFIDSTLHFQNPCDFDPLNIYILASKAVFVDQTLVRFINKGKFNVSIISPQWRVVGSQEINVDGASGATNGSPSRAKDGESGAPDGADGKAGETGGAAGSIFGIYEHSDDYEFHLSAKGGKGGDGQDGGNGFKGVDGDFVKNSFIGGNANTILKFIDDDAKKLDKKIKDSDYENNCIDEPNDHDYERDCSIYGKEGRKGGDGGKGGAAGVGGKAGKVEVNNLYNWSESLLNIAPPLDGENGKNGKGGAGGLGGKSQKIRLWYKRESYCAGWTAYICSYMLKIKMSDEKVDQASNGLNGDQK